MAATKMPTQFPALFNKNKKTKKISKNSLLFSILKIYGSQEKKKKTKNNLQRLLSWDILAMGPESKYLKKLKKYILTETYVNTLSPYSLTNTVGSQHAMWLAV